MGIGYAYTAQPADKNIRIFAGMGREYLDVYCVKLS